MPNIAASGAPSNISISNLKVTTPTIDNIVLPTANTEYAVLLPANTTRFLVAARGTSKLIIRYLTGGPEWTIWPGAFYQEDNINAVTMYLYVEANQNNETIEIVSWV